MGIFYASAELNYELALIFILIFPLLCLGSTAVLMDSPYAHLYISKSSQVPCQSCLLHKSLIILPQSVLMSLSLLKPYGTLLILISFAFLLICLLLFYHERLANCHWTVKFLNSSLCPLQLKCISRFKSYIFKRGVIPF